VVSAHRHSWSRISKTARVKVELPTGEHASYFLKVLEMDEQGAMMFRGEYESLKTIHAVSPAFAPKPHAWGVYEIGGGAEASFLLEDFRDSGKQVGSFLKILALPPCQS